MKITEKIIIIPIAFEAWLTIIPDKEKTNTSQAW